MNDTNNAPDSAATIPPLAAGRAAKTLPLLYFAGLAGIVPLFAFALFSLYSPQIEQETYANLQGIAHLKASQIEYLAERAGRRRPTLAHGRQQAVRTDRSSSA